MCSYSFVSVSVPPSLPPLLPSPLCACAVMAPRRAFPAGPNCLQFFLSFFPWCSAARVSRRERESGRKSGTTAAQRKTNGILTTHTVVYNKFFFACCCSPTFWLFVMIFRHFCQCFLRGAFHFSLSLPFSCPSFPPPLLLLPATLDFYDIPYADTTPTLLEMGWQPIHPHPHAATVHPPPLFPAPFSLFPLYPPFSVNHVWPQQLMNKLTKKSSKYFHNKLMPHFCCPV